MSLHDDPSPSPVATPYAGTPASVPGTFEAENFDLGGEGVGVNNASINRIMLSTLYCSTAYPIYQWIDDVVLWDGFPPGAAPH